MRNRYDFSKGKRGQVLPSEPEPEGKTRITIRLDQDIVDRFFQLAEESGGEVGYQTLINAALREYLDGKSTQARGYAAAHYSRGVEVKRRLAASVVDSGACQTINNRAAVGMNRHAKSLHRAVHRHEER